VVTVNANITVTANVTLTAAPLALIQTTTNCTVASTTIACLWASAQTAGDLLMCVGAWPDASTTVSSIADTKTNTYTQVPTISPKVGTALTQVAYYAQNIVAATASANTTTMTLSGAVPAISGTNLTSAASNSSLSSYSTASITPSANNLVLLTVLSHLGASNGAGPVTSVTGNSLTWVKVANLVFGGSVGSGKNNDIEIWRAMGASPPTGAVTINYGSAQGTAGWSVSQFSGTDQTGTNGSGAIGIVASAGADVATASPMSVTMGTFGSAGNGTYGGGGTDGTANTITAGTGMTILGSELNSSSVADEWATGNISPVKENYTAGGSGLLRWGIIGVEIKVPVNRRDMRCAEYSGILASGSPIDVSAAAVGTSSTPASGSITPTSTGELITGFTTSNQSVNAVSTGFTQRIRNTFGDDMEDVTGTLAASNFQPTLSASGNWVADQIVWKLAGAPVSTNFSLTMTGSGNGNGTTTSNVGTPVLNCTSTAGVTSGACSSSVTSGSTVTMIAAPKTGSVFGGYTGITGCGPSATCQVPNITSNQNVTATFNLAGVNNFFVAPTGNDSNTGTQASPWLTLSHAIATFTLGASGTIIHVADGTVPNDNAACNPFTGISTCINRGGSSTTARLTIQCDNGVGGGYAAQGHCLVRGTGGVGFLVNTNNVDIVGFDVGAQASMNTGIFVVDCGPAPNSTCGNSVHVIGNYVHDLGNGCPSQGAIEFDQNHGYTITDGQIIGNLVFRYAQDPTASSCNVAHGIYANTGNIKIQNNIVAQVPTYGITYYSSACFGSVSNNVVISAKGGMVMGTDGIATACVNQGSNTVNNNYFARITSKGTIVLDTNCTSTTTNFLGSNMSDNSAPSGDIVANGSTTCDTFSPPTFTHVSGTNMFVNYQTDGSGDYHLKAGSPGINAGTQQCSTGTGALNPCTPNTSIDGTIRPQGPQVDVSVYEQ